MYGLGEFEFDTTDTKQYYKEKLKEQTEKLREFYNYIKPGGYFTVKEIEKKFKEIFQSGGEVN